MQAATKALEASVQTSAGALEARIQSVQSETDALRSQLRTESQLVATSLQAVTGELERLRKTVSPPQDAGPGQEGFLTSRCPAPSGWDQMAYESVLLRAS